MNYIALCEMDAKRIVEVRGQEHDIIVCAVGDGTLSEVANNIMAFKKKPLIGYLPAESTNDFASSQGIPSDPLQAVRMNAVLGYQADVRFLPSWFAVLKITFFC